MARDLFHQEVVAALEKDGWRITHDPLVLPFEDINYQIDLGAEGMVGAERAGEKIAVEIKSFHGPSFSHQFHAALGQFLNYKVGLTLREPDRHLYLAMPERLKKYLTNEAIQASLNTYQVALIIFNPETKTIEAWRK